MNTVEYKMPYLMAKNYLKKNNFKKSSNEFLCQIVNEEFGLKGICVKVIIE